MKKIIILILIAFILTGCAKKYRLNRDIPLDTTEWNFRGRTISSLNSIGSDFGGQLDVKWEKKVGDGPIAPLLIGNQALIVSGSKRHIYFFDKNSGKYLGKYNINRNSETNMVVADSLGYYSVSSPGNRFYCVNLFSRKKLWSERLKDVSGTPIIIDKRLYIGTATGKVICLDRFTGKSLWQDSTMSKSVAGPSGDNQMVIFPCSNGQLAAYDAIEGGRIFDIDLGQPLMSKVALSKFVLVSTVAGVVHAIDKRDGHVIWQTKLSSAIWSSPAVDGNTVYVADNGGKLTAMNIDSGAVIWQFKTDAVFGATPIIVGDYVLVGDLMGRFYSIEKSTGRQISKREYNKEIKYSAVSDGSKIYIATADGGIHCFED